MLSNPNRYSNFCKSNVTGGIVVLSGRTLLIKHNRYIRDSNGRWWYCFFVIAFCRDPYIQYFQWRPTITDIQIANIWMVSPSIALLSDATDIFNIQWPVTITDIRMAGSSIDPLSNITGIFDIRMAGDSGILNI